MEAHGKVGFLVCVLFQLYLAGTVASLSLDPRTQLWDGGVVRYKIDHSFRMRTAPDGERNLRTTMKWIEGNSSIKFVEVSTCTKKCLNVVSIPGEGMYSGLGSRAFSPTPMCLQRRSSFTGLMHEFFHALGFSHEHQRLDARDTLWNTRINYGALGTSIIPEPTSYLTGYDNHSVTHYGGGLFRQHGAVTEQLNSMNYPSNLDWLGLQHVYSFEFQKNAPSIHGVKLMFVSRGHAEWPSVASFFQCGVTPVVDQLFMDEHAHVEYDFIRSGNHYQVCAFAGVEGMEYNCLAVSQHPTNGAHEVLFVPLGDSRATDIEVQKTLGYYRFSVPSLKCEFALNEVESKFVCKQRTQRVSEGIRYGGFLSVAVGADVGHNQYRQLTRSCRRGDFCTGHAACIDGYKCINMTGVLPGVCA